MVTPPPSPDAGIDAPIVVHEGDGGLVFDPCVENPQPGYDPTGLEECCSAGPAHCVPSNEVIPNLVGYLSACPGGDSVCMPDPIVRAGGQYQPPSCTSSVVNAPGACLSKCIPIVANNPLAVLLAQDGCGEGELCIPCLNPVDQTQTGACNLVEQLCASEADAGVGDGGVPCPYTGPPIVDPATLPDCDPACGGAHCLPASLVPPAQQPLLSTCTATGGGAGYCAPDELIVTGGNFIPRSCTSVAGAEGRCLSTCLPDIAEKAPFLPQDVCDPGEVCAPCFDPTSTDPTAPTGACTLACDMPADPPLEITCPWTGPAVIDPNVLPACAPECGGAHCVPSDLVPASLQGLLATCPGGFCAPDPLIETAGQTTLKSCRSVAGAEGRCISTCIPEIAAQANILPTDVCDSGQVCAPCFDPTSSEPTAPTGACTIGCDQPAEPPLVLTCPWTGPDVVDPATLPECAPACSGAHCVPGSLVPSNLQSLLATCDDGFCTPDPFIATAGNFLPKTCTSVAGAEGRCLSTCLPAVADQVSLLPQDVCNPDERCVPCFDPTAEDPTTPTGACTTGCDAPTQPPVVLTCPWTGPPVIDVTTFPPCSPYCSGSHCIPADLVPANERDLLASCEGGFCVPDPITATDNNWVPTTCKSVAGAEGRCLSECLPPIAAQPLLPQSTCPEGMKCAPCYDPLSDDPTAATGACSLGCDAPKNPPTKLTCPWDGPAVLDPNTLPKCSPACPGAHCLPAEYVPPNEQDQLATCPGGFCAPDMIIQTGDNWIPDECRSIAGAEGRCLSTCLPDVASQPLLPQGTCGPDERCVPCYDPTADDPTAPTGACSLGCDAPKEDPVILTCPWDGPAVIDPASFPDCSPACGGAHCLPTDLVPADEQALLAPCDGGFCAPDDIIRTDNNWVPATCRSIAGAEGRCLSTCLPDVASQPLLPTAGCGENERCVPCYDPTSADPTEPTGACSIGCDAPAEPPLVLTCPWTGPDVIDPSQLPDCSPACSGSHCLPAEYVPEDERALLSTCENGTGYCTPDPLISTDNNWVPTTCTSIAGAEGRCLSTCLPSVASQPLLPSAGCNTGERCVPCYDPTASDPDAPTGACSLGCDAPKQKPVHLTCPWTGPDVIDPSALGRACCSGAHCLPADLVPEDERGLLATCNGLYGAGYCTPDPIIRTDNNWKPTACTSVAGAEGRCLSTCLPAVRDQVLLPTAGCNSGERCVPCYDPTASNPDAPTGACSIGCDAPTKPPVHLTCPWTGPDVIAPSALGSACCSGAHCLPDQYVPSDEQGLLAGCTSPIGLGHGSCVPDDLIKAGGNVDPPNCKPFAGTSATSADGRCLSTCIPDVNRNPPLEQSNCASGTKCAPCYNPATGQNLGTCGTIGCDQPAPTTKFLFPHCCGSTGTCVPGSQLTSSQRSNLGHESCSPSSTYYCAPRDQAEGRQDYGCHYSGILGTYNSDCISGCVIDGGTDNCTGCILGFCAWCPTYGLAVAGASCSWLSGSWYCPPP